MRGLDGPSAAALVSSLVDGPSFVTAFEWHEVIDSTNRRALEALGHREFVMTKLYRSA
jgi:hypothetical protein